MKARRGSITYYLCLSLLVMLSLLFAGFSSVRQAAGRVAIASAAEQGLFSLFAGYDRGLFDRYGLLFLDGGYGGQSFRPGRLLREVRENAGYITDPKKENPLGGADILSVRLQEKGSAVTGYVLATDQSGSAFARQVCEAMRDALGGSAILAIRNRLREETGGADRLEDARKDISADKAKQYYAEDQGRLEAAEDAVPVDENPVDRVAGYKKTGLLGLVIPSSDQISAASVSRAELVSGRTRRSGMGMVPTVWQDPDEKFLLAEFLAENYPCYTGGGLEKGLQYQVEYAIAGKLSDQENLRGVLRRLLALREAANMVYLMSDSARRGEAEALADGICTALLVPEAAPAVAFAIELAWAYGESVLDLRSLVQGGRVPLKKTSDTWQLSLQNLGKLNSTGESERKGHTGLDYLEYLRILLLQKSTEELTRKTMDLTEQNIRKTDGRENFCLDCCVDAVRVELSGVIGRNSYTAERSFGYDMKIS